MNKRSNRNCCVFGCINTTIKRNELTFFKLPVSVERRNEWLKLIQREDLNGKIPAHYRVCEDHFDAESILTSPKRKVLKQNSVPKLRLPNKTYETRGSQATVKTAESNTQCDLFQTDVILQTPYDISRDTPRKRNLKNDLRECKKRLEATIAKPESTMFSRLCDKFLSKNLADIVQLQTKLKLNCPGSKYSVDYNFFCLSLLNASPQAYNLLKDTLCLPNQSALKSMYIPITTKINNNLMKVLKKKVEQMTDMERNCSLVMDTMSLKANMFYNIKEDKIYGFHEIGGIQSTEPAKYALVAMIHGIFKNYVQSVGYALLAECKNDENVTQWIDKLIKKLYEIGLNVRVFVSNTDSDFLSSAKKRLVSAEKPFFYVDSRKIFYIFDPAHLIELVRNNLMKYDFHFDNFVAKWDDILQFYEKDKTKRLKIATKLTESHVNPSSIERMKVKFALEVFSATVAAGISMYRDFGLIDPSAEGTIQLITIMNDLFDFLNSSSHDAPSKYQNSSCGEEMQIAFINNMLQFFASLKLINRNNGKDVTRTMAIKFIEGFQITLKSTLLLFEDLRIEGYSHIFTRRLHQDCLENFFSLVPTRNGNSKEPTSWQMVSALRQKIFSNILRPRKEGNCSNDLANMLLESKILYKSAIQIKQQQESTLSVASDREHEENIQRLSTKLISTTDYNTLDLPEENAIVYISGFLLKKCSALHKECDLLQSYLKYEDAAQKFAQDTRYNRYMDYWKNGGKQLLIIPQDDFIKFVESMEETFGKFFRKKIINCRIIKGLLSKVENHSFPMPCSCFPMTYCKQLYLRIRVYHTLKHNNRAFRTLGNRRKFFSVNNL